MLLLANKYRDGWHAGALGPVLWTLLTVPPRELLLAGWDLEKQHVDKSIKNGAFLP